jgi:hypothetical protein
MAKTPEGKVKDDIKAWLKARGIWFFMPVSNGFGMHGIPDFICCWGGRFLAIEAKAPGKRANTSTLQDMQIVGIHKAGGAAIVVDDVSQLTQLEERFGTSY